MELDLKEIEQTGWRVGNEIRGIIEETNNTVFLAVYALYIVKTERCSNEEELRNVSKRYLSNQESEFMFSNIRGCVDTLIDISEEFTINELHDFIICYSTQGPLRSREHETPESICNLALRLLDIKDSDTIADFGSGKGNFLVKSALENKAKVYGIDINADASIISSMRLKMIRDDAFIENDDMFNRYKDFKFKKIFSNYPLGMRLKYLDNATEYINYLSNKIPDIKKGASADWIFNSLIVDSLEDDGIAVAIMANGSTWNNIDKYIRKHFVEEGFIKCIIYLPDKLFSSTAISTTLIVMSKGNKNIRMIDARNIYQKGRRQNSFSQKDIEEIVSLVNKDSDISMIVSLNDLVENNYLLNPARYLEEKIEINDGVKFGSVIKKITRAAQVKASELDKISSEKETPIQYLMLSNIKDGLIDDNLPYLKSLDDRYKKYCIEDKDLLISKMGSPFKIAVAELDNTKTLLGNGNLYIIKLDTDKVNPYYLKAFFESEKGTALLKSICVGTVMMNIPMEPLKSIVIPLIPICKQNIIADKYIEKITQIKKLEEKVLTLQNEIKTMINEEI